MNRVDVVLESFDFDPLGSKEPYYTDEMFQEGQQFLEDTVNSARTGVTKKNFVQRIWETIKKIWAWCCKQWSRFVNWLRRVFKKKNNKTADQVLSDVIGTTDKTGSTPRGGSVVTTNNNSVNGSSHQSSTSGIQSIKVDLPSNPSSEAPPEPSIDVLLKPIMISYDAVADAFGISINGANSYGDGAVKGQSNTAPRDYVLLLAMIDRPDVFEKLKNACLILRQEYNIGKITSKFYKAVVEFDKATAGGFRADTNWVVPFRKLNEFQKSLNEIMEIIGDVNISEEIVFENEDIMQTFNNLAGWCAKLQMSMNSFTRVASEVHKIDAAYIGSVKTQETLDKFVKGMIDAGIPPKYIGYNTYLACDLSLKGDKGDENNPIWGQSRLVLFPQSQKDNIIKVALSGWGVQSNRSEYATSQMFVKNNGSDLISVTRSISNTGATVTSERVDANGRSLDPHDVQGFKSSINTFISRHNLPIAISDLHGGNIGTKGKHIVAIDYAWSDRRSS